MVTLEQIRQLDAKVAKAVELISQLRRENQALTEKLGTYQQRIDELEVLISDFKKSQGEIENGIIHALEELDKLEGTIVPPKTEARAVEAPDSGTEDVSAREDLGESTEPAEDSEDEEEEAEGEEGDRGSELDIF